MNQLLTKASIKTENLVFSGTAGVSHENRDNGFRPAFYDTESGKVEISRFQNGLPAPMHIIDGLPNSWVVERDADLKATAIKCSVVVGFVHNGYFYTRSQAAEMAECM